MTSFYFTWWRNDIWSTRLYVLWRTTCSNFLGSRALNSLSNFSSSGCGFSWKYLASIIRLCWNRISPGRIIKAPDKNEGHKKKKNVHCKFSRSRIVHRKNVDLANKIGVLCFIWTIDFCCRKVLFLFVKVSLAKWFLCPNMFLVVVTVVPVNNLRRG